jgi:hypothetical protein
MKILLYILAVVVIAGTAVLSFNNRVKYQNQVTIRKEVFADNGRLDASIASNEKTLKGLRDEVAATRDSIAIQIADLERLEAAYRTSTKELLELDAKMKELAERLAEQEAVRKEVAAILGSENVTLEELPGEIDKINTQLEEQRIAKDKLVKLVTDAETAVAGAHDEVGRLQSRVSTRAIAISRNAMQSVITGVNNDWGFAVVGSGSGTGVTAETRFLVQRDGHAIARLVPTAIEAGQTITDIDPKSIKRGVTLRAGDIVILQNVNK